MDEDVLELYEILFKNSLRIRSLKSKANKISQAKNSYTYFSLIFDKSVALPQFDILNVRDIDIALCVSFPSSEHTGLFLECTLDNFALHLFCEPWYVFFPPGNVTLVEEALGLKLILSFPILSLIERFLDSLTFSWRVVSLLLLLDLFDKVGLSWIFFILILDHVVIFTWLRENR